MSKLQTIYVHDLNKDWCSCNQADRVFDKLTQVTICGNGRCNVRRCVLFEHNTSLLKELNDGMVKKNVIQE